MDKELLIENFVRKRETFRKFAFSSFFGFVIYALVGGDIFYHSLSVDSKEMYEITVLIWILINIVISKYIGHTLSVCPVCNLEIPTTHGRRRHNRNRMYPGNGPLPDYCPYCHTDFSKYKTME